MKSIFTTLILLSFCFPVFGQDCGDLFFSAYVEGSNNNKAVEIYNPTPNAVSLNNYSIARFSNGSTSAAVNYIANIGELAGGNNVNLPPYSTFVVALDKRDENGICADYPVWDGNLYIDVLLDMIGEPILDSSGNPVSGPQYEEVDCGGANLSFYPIHGDEYPYMEEYDLAGKANIFASPEYAINRAMYFNGNDAVALIAGLSVENDYSNVIDVVGVIGEDPSDIFPAVGAWIDSLGNPVTKDRSLIRSPEQMSGTVKISSNGDQWDPTTDPYEWTTYARNDFSILGEYQCICDPNYMLIDTMAIDTMVIDTMAVDTMDIDTMMIDTMNIDTMMIDSMNIDTMMIDSMNMDTTGTGYFELDKLNISIFPNPSQGWLYLNIEANEGENVRIRIFNTNGQMVQSTNPGLLTRNRMIEVDLNDLESGIYFVEVNGITRKIILQK